MVPPEGLLFSALRQASRACGIERASLLACSSKRVCLRSDDLARQTLNFSGAKLRRSSVAEPGRRFEAALVCASVVPISSTPENRIG
jgi:hypothetical protein